MSDATREGIDATGAEAEDAAESAERAEVNPPKASGSAGKPNFEREIVSFAAQLHADVLERAMAGEADTQGVSGASDYKENVFTAVVVDELIGAGVLDDGEVCFYAGKIGQGHARVNGYAIADDDSRLDVFATVYTGNAEPATVSWDQWRKAFAQAVRFISAAVQGRHGDFEPSSGAYHMAEQIHRVSGGLAEARVFILSDAVATQRSLEPEMLGGLKVSGHVWDLERIFRSVGAERPHEAIEIDLVRECGDGIECLPVPGEGLDYDAYLCVVPGEVLFRLYEEYGARLLELNVRSFLQARGKVNKGIRDTIAGDPQHFFPYNNGLSMTASEVETESMPNGSRQITRIKALQIVNGGQTTASIHRARKVDRLDISRVFVQAKLTVVGGDRLERMVPLISRFANSQNAVNEADFSANHPVHIELERLSLTTWIPGEQGRWFYERARGQYQVARGREGSTPARLRNFDERTPTSRKFAKTDLAKYANTWERKPHKVSQGGQKNFVAFMDGLRLKGKGWLPDKQYYTDLIAKALLFKSGTRMVAEEGFEAYRANIVTYTLAVLVERTHGQLQLDRIWMTQKVPDYLERTIRRWSHSVDQGIRESAAGRNVTEWCKREECWNTIRALDLELPAELRRAVERGAAHNGLMLTQDDLERITSCRALPSDVWYRIHQWAMQNGRLTPTQKGVVATMGGHAASGWPDDAPSPKQAKQAMLAYEAALEAGALD